MKVPRTVGLLYQDSWNLTNFYLRGIVHFLFTSYEQIALYMKLIWFRKSSTSSEIFDNFSMFLKALNANPSEQIYSFCECWREVFLIMSSSRNQCCFQTNDWQAHSVILIYSRWCGRVMNSDPLFTLAFAGSLFLFFSAVWRKVT